MLGFKFELGTSVFESADTWDRLPISARVAAYKTGRMKPELYFHGNRGGAALLNAEAAWFKKTFGVPPSAVSYAHGVDDDGLAVSKVVFGARNSRWDYRTSYGRSQEKTDTYLGWPVTEFGPDYYRSMASSTRVFDAPLWATNAGVRNPLYGRPLEDSFQRADDTLAQAIQSRGWYSDFTHWNTPSGPNLYRFLERQDSVMDSASGTVARVAYGDAVAYRFVRDSARVTIEENDDGSVDVHIGYALPPAYPPLAAARTPLFVKVDLSESSLSGGAVAVDGGDIYSRPQADEYVVRVPFAVSGSVVRFVPSSNEAALDSGAPKVTWSWSGSTLRATFDRPVKAGLFVARSELGKANAADAVWRSEKTSSQHAVNVAGNTQRIGGNVAVIAGTGHRLGLFLGGIDSEGRSTLVQVSRASSRATRLRVPMTHVAPYRSPTRLYVRLLDSSSTPIPQQQVLLEQATSSGWRLLGAARPVSQQSGSYAIRVTPPATAAGRYRFRYGGMRGVYASAITGTITVKSKAKLTTPGCAPVAAPGSRVRVTGSLGPVHRPGTAVWIRMYKYSSGRWAYQGSTRVLTDDDSRYSGKVTFPSKGKWKVHAYHGDAGHAPTFSGYRYVTVL